MSSIIEGYNYDIFISCRQKDNKGEMWVSEFVEALKTELESTFKEEISVYFDFNPHDGLLETHDVDESLKGKLKCLIFIPILSRTYCDPKSFAWEHEFKAFIEQASHDQFGIKIKLPNGNVASRVLPVCIHDLEDKDLKLFESVLEGVLRGVAFIYKEPGVNRPLRTTDNEEKNLNNTKYRNQINKVALAIKEIIQGLKSEPPSATVNKILTIDTSDQRSAADKIKGLTSPIKFTKRKVFSGVAIIVILAVAVILFSPRIFNRDRLADINSRSKITVAVMPFQNMTNDTIWNIWQSGIQENLITYLSNFLDDLIVRQPESVNALIQSKGLTNYASITPSIGSLISKKLEAKVFICGSIQQAGPVLRINAKLIDSETKEILKSFEIDGPYNEETIFYITDSIRKKVTDFLLISKLVNKVPGDFRSFANTNSPEAYRYFIYGNNSLLKGDFSAAVKWYLQAVKSDSGFIFAAYMLATAYGNQWNIYKAKEWSRWTYDRKHHVPLPQELLIKSLYASFFETPVEDIGYLKQLLEIDDQQPLYHSLLGGVYYKFFQYDKAIPELEKVLEIYKKWRTKPMIVTYYWDLGMAYHMIGDYEKERLIYNKAARDFPNETLLNWRRAVNSFAAGDTIAGQKYINAYIAYRKQRNTSEATLSYVKAQIYSEAGILDKAEKCYREALSAEPENIHRLGTLAYFLIDKNLNISEGLVLAEKTLMSVPESYWLLDIKGWGLFKQGKYKEALEILQKGWIIRRQIEGYDHEAYLHLETAKKAYADQI